MFKPGDTVVHKRHGAGTVIETRTLVYEGEEREYFCIKMNDDQRTLMIPIENVDNDELRPAMTDIREIAEVLNQEPNELDEDYRIRQANIRQQFKTRNPYQLAQALRDLIYLEKTHKLTSTDTRLRDQLSQALARELALLPSLTIAKARQYLQDTIDQAMSEHLADYEATSANT